MEVSLGSALFRGMLVLGAAAVISSLVLVSGAQKVRSADQSMVGTGSARQRIHSDLAVWDIALSRQSPTVAGAYQSLAADLPKVRAYLKSKGILDTQITASSITSQAKGERDTDGRDTGKIVAYELRQHLTVRSTTVEQVEQLSREAVGDLLKSGVLVESQAPQYLYTKIGDLKVTMLGEAAKDAKARAEKIAQNVGSRIGGVRAARMGVLQITPADSTEVSGEGMNDTSAIDKDITSVISMTFGVE